MVRLRLLIFVLLTTAGFSSQAAVSASIDKNPLLAGETLTLSISSESGGAEPDLSVLEPDFQVLGTSSSSQFQIINGRTQRSHEWIVQLRPTRLGELTIPAIALGGERTAPIAVRVQQPQLQAGELPEAFIEFEADKSRAYVREQVLLTSRLFVRGNLVSGNFSEPSSDTAVIEQLGEQSETQTLRGAHRYRVIERRYALFAEHSGELNIAAPVFNGELSTGQQRRSIFGFSGGTRAIYAAADPLSLNITPAEPGYPGYWLPASQVTLEQSLSPQDGPWTAGEPLTRTVTVRVQGQMHTQLPDLDIPVPDGHQSYTEPPQDSTYAQANGLSAQRQYSVALIPASGGELVLPRLELRWWDTQNKQLQLAVLPEMRLPIAPATSQPQAATPRTASIAADPAPRVDAANSPIPESTPVWPWQVAAAAAIAGWLGTLLAWWLQQRPAQQPQNLPSTQPSHSRRALIRSLQHDDATTCRANLLNWAREEIPDLNGLLELTQHSEDSDLADALAQLDAAAFGRASDFERQILIGFVKGFRYAETTHGTKPLAPLYPET